MRVTPRGRIYTSAIGVFLLVPALLLLFIATDRVLALAEAVFFAGPVPGPF